MVIVLYCLALLAVGWWCRREARDSAGYFLASRRLSAVQAGLTLASTALGGSAILVASQMVYRNGLAGIWFKGSVALGFGVLGFFFARRIRESGAHSLAHFIGLSYGPAARRLASLLIVAVEVAFFSLTVKSFALVTTPLFNESRWLAASPVGFEVAITAVFVIYTMMGGQKAVALTDYLQIAIIFIGLLGVLLPVALFKTDLSRLPAGFLRFPFSGGAGPVYVLNMLAMMGLSGIIGGDVFSKILSVADARSARRAALLAAGLLGALAVAMALLALCARVHLPALTAPDEIAGSVLKMARQLLPGALFQLITLAFLSALLSTGDSVLLTGATVLGLDVLRLGDRIPMAVHRLLTALLALAGLALALYFQGILEIMRFGYTLLVAALVVPVMVTLAAGPRRRVVPGVAIGAMAAGVAAATAWQLAQAYHLVASPLDPAVMGVAASAAVMVSGLRINGNAECGMRNAE